MMIFMTNKDDWRSDEDSADSIHAHLKKGPPDDSPPITKKISALPAPRAGKTPI
jgi:hypothetical protein